MSQLDKTFPTNDCSMCILSPKFIECATNPNISIITDAQVDGIAGEAGNFEVTLLQKPKIVDPIKMYRMRDMCRVLPDKRPRSL